jgi:hypothetical protein
MHTVSWIAGAGVGGQSMQTIRMGEISHAFISSFHASPGGMTRKAVIKVEACGIPAVGHHGAVDGASVMRRTFSARQAPTSHILSLDGGHFEELLVGQADAEGVDACHCLPAQLRTPQLARLRKVFIFNTRVSKRVYRSIGPC